MQLFIKEKELLLVFIVELLTSQFWNLIDFFFTYTLKWGSQIFFAICPDPCYIGYININKPNHGFPS